MAVTRGKGGEDGLSARLRDLGARVLDVPAIAVAPPESWAELDAALSNLDQFDWIAFASATAVDATLSRIVALGMAPPPVGTRLAAVGKATADRLHERLRAPDLVPMNATGAALAAAKTFADAAAPGASCGRVPSRSRGSPPTRTRSARSAAGRWSGSCSRAWCSCPSRWHR